MTRGRGSPSGSPPEGLRVEELRSALRGAKDAGDSADAGAVLVAAGALLRLSLIHI